MELKEVLEIYLKNKYLYLEKEDCKIYKNSKGIMFSVSDQKWKIILEVVNVGSVTIQKVINEYSKISDETKEYKKYYSEKINKFDKMLEGGIK